jgi:phospholipase/carboxylesterase
MKHEKGFHYLEFPARGGKADALVIILHGHNNHPEMFGELPAQVQREHPGADVLILRGPIALNVSSEHKARKGVPHVDDLYTWHRLERKWRGHVTLALGRMFNRVGVVNRLNDFIDHQLAARGLQDENLAVFGFSMGGAIAVEAATRRARECAAVVCHSGLVLPQLKAKAKPEILMVMGESDALFYTQRLTLPAPRTGRVKKVFHKAAARVSLHHDDSVRRLKKAGVPVSEHLVEGLNHTINRQSFGQSVDFIKKRLAK